MPRLMSFKETWDAFIKRSKRVTRRSRRSKGLWLPGWPTLKVGDIIEGIEWTPRWAPHGERWACPGCGWLGDTDPSVSALARMLRGAAHAKARPACIHHPDPDPGGFEWRAPERLPGTEGHRRIVSVRDELLGDITPDEVALEGFPDWSTERFIHMYSGGRAPDRARSVNRIEFEVLP